MFLNFFYRLTDMPAVTFGSLSRHCQWFHRAAWNASAD